MFQTCPIYINTCRLIFEISGDFDNRLLKLGCGVPLKKIGFSRLLKELSERRDV